ncbi:uncharacterized protein K02A2.6-like isoform X1 [Ixodes scapularis]|uniref:uncharacterized protein K02A2.6-like isoform X1 n=1 Tax=Ixodes scapularis TaxID=6945 RepID=UPI001A9F67E9|nr:uncharacterized protein K02A2.6-like isoform X1 [Ixodes scapularis]
MVQAGAEGQDLLEEFADVFEEKLGCCQGPPVKLYRKEDARPRFCKARPVPYALRDKVSAEINRLEKDGVLSPVSVSEWATPVVPVAKKNGEIRLCGDFKLTVNPATHLERYPLPKIDDIFAALYGGELFTTLDLRNAYNQLPLDEEARKMTVLNTHQGLYCYNRLAFGIASAPALFQRRIESLLQGLPRVQVYLDDIVIAEKKHDTSTLRQVLQRLRENGLKLNRAKCRIREKQVSFLGHRIDAQGLHPERTNLEAVTEAPRPTSEEGSSEVLTEYVLYTRGWDDQPMSAQQMATLTTRDSLLRQVKAWIYAGWPSHLRPEQHQFLPYFSRRSTPMKEGKSPAELLLGFRPRTRLTGFFSRGEEAQHSVVEPQAPATTPPPFSPGMPVWSRQFQPRRRWLPGTVVSSEGRRMVTLRTPDGQQRRHLDQLRPRDASGSPEGADKARRVAGRSEVGARPPSTDEREVATNGDPEVTPTADPVPLRRSTRLRKPPDRLNL